jgi:hypothetical protein
MRENLGRVRLLRDQPFNLGQPRSGFTAPG